MSMVHKRLFTVVTFLLCFATSLLAEQIKVKKLNRQNPPSNCVNNLCKDERSLSEKRRNALELSRSAPLLIFSLIRSISHNLRLLFRGLP